MSVKLLPQVACLLVIEEYIGVVENSRNSECEECSVSFRSGIDYARVRESSPGHRNWFTAAEIVYALMIL